MSLNDCPPLLFDLHPQHDGRLNQSPPSNLSNRFDRALGASSPPPKGGVGDYVSPSRLTLWLRCPLAFKLRYVDGIETPPSPSQFLGRVVHAGLESWYRHRQLGFPLESADLCRRLDAWWEHAAGQDQVRFSTIAEEGGCRRQAVDLVRTYLDQLAPNEPTPLAVEKSVEAPTH